MGKVRKQRKSLPSEISKESRKASTSLETRKIKSTTRFNSLKGELEVLSKKNKRKLKSNILRKKLLFESETEETLKYPSLVDNSNSLLPLEVSKKIRESINNPQRPKIKGIEKASKQKKKHLQGIDMYKQILKNKTFQKNPLLAISEHVKAVVEAEKSQK